MILSNLKCQIGQLFEAWIMVTREFRLWTILICMLNKYQTTKYGIFNTSFDTIYYFLCKCILVKKKLILNFCFTGWKSNWLLYTDPRQAFAISHSFSFINYNFYNKKYSMTLLLYYILQLIKTDLPYKCKQSSQSACMNGYHVQLSQFWIYKR